MAVVVGPERAELAAPARRSDRWPRVVVAVLGLAFVVAGLIEAANDAPTIDEGVDVSSGVTSLVRRDLRLSPEHPPLPKLLSALPALAAGPIIPEGEAWEEGDWFDHADDFVRANDEAGRLREVLFLARLVPIAEGVACGVLLFLLGRRLAGEAAGAVAAGLWFTTPVVVGLSHLAMLDVPFTLTVLLVSLALLRDRDEPSLRTALVVGLACGAAVSTRHLGLVLLPVAATVVATAPGRRSAADRPVPGAVLAVLLVPLLCLWIGYRGFDPTPPEGRARERLDSIVSAGADESAVVRLATAVPAPVEYRAGLGFLALTAEERPAFLLGHAWDGSRWWFFPASALVKLPLGALAAVAIGGWWWTKVPVDRRRSGLVAVAAPAGALGLALLVQPLNSGLRLALPVVALAFVAASPIALVGRHRAGRIGLALLAVTQLVALAVAVPHTLAWTAPPFQPGYRVASNSNLDVGQDLYRLRRWSEGRAPWVAIATSRGMTIPAEARPLLDAPPSQVTGWVAVGATQLTALHRDELAWLRSYCPVGTIGGSILVYRFDRPPRAEPGPTKPAAPCPDDRYSHR